MLGDVHLEIGKSRILSCIQQISVVQRTDFCSQEGQSVGRLRDTVAHRVAAQMVLAFTGGKCTVPHTQIHDMLPHHS
jgi:hypothetical protein